MSCTPYDYFLWAVAGFVLAMCLINTRELWRELRAKKEPQ